MPHPPIQFRRLDADLFGQLAIFATFATIGFVEIQGSLDLFWSYDFLAFRSVFIERTTTNGIRDAPVWNP